MLRSLLLMSSLILCEISFAQPAKKAAAKDKPPSQKEMQDMMKEMQKELNGISAEDKKVMDSLGIKMPSVKSIPKITDKQLADAWEDESRIVPKRDAARIAAIPKAVPDPKMRAYIAAVQNKLASAFKPEVISMGSKVYDFIKSNSKNANEAANMTMGLWLAGKPAIAIYVLGKLCAEDAGNTDNLSNYAAMLSLLGAQHLAIPVLNNLNASYPKNSTLLNNLGQAWFGLGEMQKAEKYFDSTIRIYAYHPQACLSKSLIEESKGNKTEAINLVKKSILHSYSKEKEERLRKLGYTLTSKDVWLPRKTKADPLNLGGSSHPVFPKSVDECISMEPEWESFRQQLKEKAAPLGKELEEAWKITMDMHQKRTDENMKMVKASINGGSPQGELTLVPIYASKSYLKQREVTDDYNRKLEQWSKKAAGFFSGSGLKLTQAYEAEIEKLREADVEQTGEGLPNKDFCPRYKEASDKYLSAYNSETESLFNEHLEMFKVYLNDLTYLQMYSEWPEKFEALKLQAQISWLGALAAESQMNFISITKYKCAKRVTGESGKLAKFDDIACRYNDTMNLKIITFYNNCSRMTSEFDFMFLNYVRKDDFERAEDDTYISSTVKLSAEAGKDWKAGPVKVEVKVGAGVELEFGREGLEDVTLIGEVKAGAGTGILDEDEKLGTTGIGIIGKDAFPTTLEIGVEGRISIITGKGSLSGSGILKDIKISDW